MAGENQHNFITVGEGLFNMFIFITYCGHYINNFI